MSELFGHGYAEAYDLLYGDKDYAAECDQLEGIFAKYGRTPVKSVLDLGCGTGNHAVALARRGLNVVGVDRSTEMLVRARAKADAGGLSARTEFRHGDVRSTKLEQQFDAVLMMFAVLGYQLENAHVSAALHTARSHLLPGGLFVFDFWYGPAVLHERPSQRIKVVETDHGRLLRATSGELSTRHHVCHVDYRVWQLGVAEATETVERHTMRFFFPLELEFFLNVAGFTLERLGAFPDFDREPDETTWNVLAVARAT